MKTTCLSILLFLFLSTPLFSQFIAVQKGDKVEVRTINGGYMISGYYAGLKDIAQGDNTIILWFASGKVEVRDSGLRYISSGYHTNLRKISATADYVVLYFNNNKLEVRDMDLRYISSWYH